LEAAVPVQNDESSQNVPFLLISSARGARHANAEHTHVQRTATLSGPPVRIPALPVLTVTGNESASDVQADRMEPMSPKSGLISDSSRALAKGCSPGTLDASCSTEADTSRKLAHAGSWADASSAESRLFFGRYEMLCKIGHGGMSTVYLCRVRGEADFHRLFALKALRPDLSRDPVHTRLFLQEARVAASIHHPNVVSIIDAGVSNGQPYVAMDYVEGLSLSGLLERSRSRRSPRLLVPIILDALNGLHAAHEASGDDGTPLGLVHCDISPQNLLVGTDGIGRLTDFGVARARGLHQRTTRGKPAFLSPEQLIGETLDRRSDIFSIGTVMWCALTGEHLFKGSSIEATMTNVIRRRIEPPSHVGLKPPECLDALVLKALERDPQHRFQSAAEMLDGLREVALANDLFGASSEVAEWIQRSFGPDLERRRRVVREAASRTLSRSAPSPRLEPEPGTLSESASTGSCLAHSTSNESERTSTLTLPKRKRGFSLLLAGAVIVSILTLGLSLLFSSAISRLLSANQSSPPASATGATSTKEGGEDQWKPPAKP
jgi:serine/threonine protein kinase